MRWAGFGESPCHINSLRTLRKASQATSSQAFSLEPAGAKLLPSAWRDAILEFQGGFSARVNVQFFIDMLKMPFDRGHRYSQPVGDFLVSETLHDQLEDFALARGKFFGFHRRLPDAELADDLSRDLRRHGHATLRGLANRGENAFGLGALEQVAA